MQSSYEWECHHLRPAYIAVSVLQWGESPNTFAGSILRIVPLIFFLSPSVAQYVECNVASLYSVLSPEAQK